MTALNAIRSQSGRLITLGGRRFLQSRPALLPGAKPQVAAAQGFEQNEIPLKKRTNSITSSHPPGRPGKATIPTPYCACARAAAMSASLRTDSTAILLERA